MQGVRPFTRLYVGRELMLMASSFLHVLLVDTWCTRTCVRACLLAGVCVPTGDTNANCAVIRMQKKSLSGL